VAFDFLTFLSNLFGIILGAVLTLGWLVCSYMVAVHFDSWIAGMTMFLIPSIVFIIFKLGQK
jgi:hypothetical protein